MSSTDTITFSRPLADGLLLQIAVSFSVVSTNGTHMVTGMVNESAPPATPETPVEAPRLATKRHTGESDEVYLQRLIKRDLAPPRMLSDWADCLSVSLRKLTAEKKAGRLKWVERGETKGGNAHLISANDVLEAVMRLNASKRSIN